MPFDDEISSDMKALFAKTREAEKAPAGAKEAIWAKTIAQIEAGPAPSPAPANIPASAIRNAAIAGFAAGVLSGIAGTWIAVSAVVAPVAPQPERTPVAIATPAATPTAVAMVTEPAPTATPIAAATPKTAKRDASATPAASPASTQVASASVEYATERAWIEAARTELRKGNVDEASKMLESARLRFPNGSLTEEREAIAVHVLIARGEVAAAKLALETFRKRHEGSLFLSGIEQSLRDLGENP